LKVKFCGSLRFWFEAEYVEDSAVTVSKWLPSMAFLEAVFATRLLATEVSVIRTRRTNEQDGLTTTKSKSVTPNNLCLSSSRTLSPFKKNCNAMSSFSLTLLELERETHHCVSAPHRYYECDEEIRIGLNNCGIILTEIRRQGTVLTKCYQTSKGEE